MNFNHETMSLFLGFLLCAYCTYKAIPIMREKQLGQNIREEGPKSHQSKSGTPSMGGIAIIIAVVVGTLVSASKSGYLKDGIICSLGFLAFGSIGFLDDYLKVIKKQNEGLKSKEKFLLQLLFAIGFAVYLNYFTNLGTQVYIPFFKTYVDFGVMYMPFVVFTILAMSNGVNLTDGLDGLASGVTFVVAVGMALISQSLENVGVEIFYLTLAGACIGFLMFNKNPAKIFMGDTGSLAIGGGITVSAFLIKMEFILPIIGIIYVAETVSVILQVGYFKITKGKRLFRMAPLHHHFEEGGMKETRVVQLFWTISILAMFFVKIFA